MPDTGWGVGSWTGTDDDQSTSATNTVTMPASAHAASVSYVQSCYALSLSHTGSGTNPVASPTSSPSCSAGEYYFGEEIQLNAMPDTGWVVGSWTGTDSDQSTSTNKTVTMPARAQAASVNYVQACYALSLSHTGSGTDPAANPTSSQGCSAGEYYFGEEIQLTATPDSGWGVDSWTGTDNDQSTSTMNTLTMPAIAHSVSIIYLRSCTYSISPTHGSFWLDGGDGLVTVTTENGCLWAAVSNDVWISITSGISSSGSGSVTYSVASNGSARLRTGTVMIAGQTFTVTQSGSELFVDDFETGDTSKWTSVVSASDS
jgi:hypothetical protein